MIPDHHERQAAQPSYDGPVSYAGPTGHAGRCYLQIFERRGGLPVVLAWEEKSNPGASVTNAAAQVATQAWRQFLPQAREGLVFIEAYVDRRPLHGAPGERFAEVTFDLDGDALHSPHWWHRERAEVERLIGGPINLPVESSY